MLVFREIGSKLKDKWSDRFDGPFVVVEELGSNIYMALRMVTQVTDAAPREAVAPMAYMDRLYAAQRCAAHTWHIHAAD